MTRNGFLDSLHRHATEDGPEAEARRAIRDFVRRSANPFSRSNPEGHVTASAVVARSDASEFLLLRHRKLGRWLQPGGHLEPEDSSVFAAALREAREETGIETFEFPIGEEILDVDIHPIPPHGPDLAHFHYDIRHLFTVTVATPDGWLPDGAAWFSLRGALAAGVDDSLARALRKAADHLTRHPAPRT